MNVLQGWVNPFSGSIDIISLSTAREAPPEIAADLIKAHDIGKYSQFETERLESNPPIKKFHDRMKMNKLKTFSNLYKKRGKIQWMSNNTQSRPWTLWVHHIDGPKPSPSDGRCIGTSHGTSTMGPCNSAGIPSENR